MGLFGARVCHLLDPAGLQDQRVGKDLLGWDHRRLLVGPPASSETRELVVKVKFSGRYPKHITFTANGDNICRCTIHL